MLLPDDVVSDGECSVRSRSRSRLSEAAGVRFSIDLPPDVDESDEEEPQAQIRPAPWCPRSILTKMLASPGPLTRRTVGRQIKEGLLRTGNGFNPTTESKAQDGRNLLEIFAGVGSVAAAWRRRGGEATTIDLCQGPQEDLRNQEVQRRITLQVAERKFEAVFLAPPCSSFSVARDWRNPVRSHQKPQGLSGLNASQQREVSEGNLLAAVSLSIFRMCMELGVPSALENPASSRLWKLHDFETLISQCKRVSPASDASGVLAKSMTTTTTTTAATSEKCASSLFFVTCHQCQFGTAWRKPTSFLVCNVDVDKIVPLYKKCGTSKICERSKLPHTVLEGGSRTKAAQTYPESLSTALATMLS